MKRHPRWQLGKKLGEGATAKVYKCKERETGGIAALKLQTEELDEDTLVVENAIYERLHDPNVLPGIPEVYDFEEGDNYRFLVMDCLGPSLYDVLQQDRRRRQEGMSMKTVFMIGLELVQIVDSMHSKNVFHLDLKDQNVVIGYGMEEENRIYVVDFGMSLYIDEDGDEICANDSNVPEIEGAETMRRKEYLRHLKRACRIRDYAGVLSTLMYLVNPTVANEEMVDPLGVESLESVGSEEDRQELFGHFPAEFLQFLTYLDSVPDNRVPDKAKLELIFRRGMISNGFPHDGIFDWME